MSAESPVALEKMQERGRYIRSGSATKIWGILDVNEILAKQLKNCDHHTPFSAGRCGWSRVDMGASPSKYFFFEWDTCKAGSGRT